MPDPQCNQFSCFRRNTPFQNALLWTTWGSEMSCPSLVACLASRSARVFKTRYPEEVIARGMGRDPGVKITLCNNEGTALSSTTGVPGNPVALSPRLSPHISSLLPALTARHIGLLQCRRKTPGPYHQDHQNRLLHHAQHQDHRNHRRHRRPRRRRRQHHESNTRLASPRHHAQSRQRGSQTASSRRLSRGSPRRLGRRSVPGQRLRRRYRRFRGDQLVGVSLLGQDAVGVWRDRGAPWHEPRAGRGQDADVGALPLVDAAECEAHVARHAGDSPHGLQGEC